MAWQGTACDLALPGRMVIDHRAWDALVRALMLSGRERELVQGVFDDLKESAIAAELGISRHTVHTHFQRLYQKLGVSSRVMLVIRVFQAMRQLENDGDAFGDTGCRVELDDMGPRRRIGAANPLRARVLEVHSAVTSIADA